MAELPVNANIAEEGGAYYQVRLEWLPRAGELIDLHSFLDQANGDPTPKWYVVTQVVHKLQDVTEKFAPSLKGGHFVTVYVRPSADKHFR